MRLALVVLLSISAQLSSPYKILVYNPLFGHSHSNFVGRIADILVDAGHNVTSLLPIMDPHCAQGTEKSRKIIIQPDPLVREFHESSKRNEMNFFEMNAASPIVPFFLGPMLSDMFSRTCKLMVSEPGLLDKLRDEQFDVMIAENFDTCGMGISKFIAPKSMIAVSSSSIFGTQNADFGIETGLSYVPSLYTYKLDVHSFFSRLENLLNEWKIRTVFWFGRRAINRVMREHFGDGYPSVEVQSANVAYVFSNSETLIESAAPMTSRVIHLGGIGAKQPKELDEYWSSILARRPKTVLLSFGSMAKSMIMPIASKRGFLKAIARFPEVTFIWKYEDLEDEFARDEASKVENLVLTKWMPQVDILAHPRLAAFITHGGMGSTQETALRGVPGIFIPLFADQPRNAGMMEFNGVGRVFDKYELWNDEKLAETIRDVLENDKYRTNAQKISRMLAKKPHSSKELLVKHVEFAAEFGPSAALRPRSVDMSMMEYNNLDIIAAGFIVSLLIGYVSFKLFIAVARRLLVRISKEKSE